MNTKQPNRLLGVLFLGTALTLPSASAVAATQKSFPTPEAAMEAFGAALLDNDEAAKRTILGAGYGKIIPPVGAQARYLFIEAWVRTHRIVSESERAARIAVGDKGWTLPIPLVKTNGGWRFDMKAGEQEIMVRQIGRNELAAIGVARTYGAAQKEYFARDRDGDGVLEYAQKITSSPGKQDGLYWPEQAGAEISPLGPLMAAAAAEKGRKPGSYHGYRYRVLTAQGPQAAGGARNYIDHGNMTGGFALLAWPANYGRSGIMSFMINQDGQVLEKNLGPATAEQAARLQSFNPDATWRQVDDNP